MVPGHGTPTTGAGAAAAFGTSGDKEKKNAVAESGASVAADTLLQQWNGEAALMSDDRFVAAIADQVFARMMSSSSLVDADDYADDYAEEESVADDNGDAEPDATTGRHLLTMKQQLAKNKRRK